MQITFALDHLVLKNVKLYVLDILKHSDVIGLCALLSGISENIRIYIYN